jgi:hypothetical protein
MLELGKAQSGKISTFTFITNAAKVGTFFLAEDHDHNPITGKHSG